MKRLLIKKCKNCGHDCLLHRNKECLVFIRKNKVGDVWQTVFQCICHEEYNFEIE